MNKLLKLEFGEYYHIYNRGNNYDIIFYEEKNYEYFLKLYIKHLLPITELYAYCLLPNHFHLLLKIKPEEELGYFREEIELLKKSSQEHLFISRKFSNFLNAYSKAITQSYNRRGSLFQERFGRIKIENDTYFSSLIYYIHSNPVKHNFTESFKDYPYSSYKVVEKNEKSIIRKDIIINWFGSLSEFIKYHSNNINIDKIKKLTLE